MSHKLWLILCDSSAAINVVRVLIFLGRDSFVLGPIFEISENFAKNFQMKKRLIFWQIQSLELEKLELRKTN